MNDATASTPAPEASAPVTDSAASAESRPSSIDDAFQQAFTELETAAGESVPPAPAPTPDQGTTPAPAREGPPDQTAEAAQPAPAAPRGPIPYERHEEILKNARVKEREAVVQQIRQQFGGGLEVVQRLQQDTAGTLAQFIEEVSAHPDLSRHPQLIAAAARLVSAQRGRVAEDIEPQPDLQTQDGLLVYSAEQHAQREAWMKRQLMQETEQRYGPVLEAHQHREAVQQARAYLDQQVERARPTAEAWEQRPHFKQHKAAIMARQAELAAQGHQPWSALGMAYAEIVETQVLPRVAQHSQQSLVSQAAAKMRGSTDNPAQPRAARNKPIRSIDDAFDQALAELGVPVPNR